MRFLFTRRTDTNPKGLSFESENKEGFGVYISGF